MSWNTWLLKKSVVNMLLPYLQVLHLYILLQDLQVRSYMVFMLFMKVL